MKKQTTKKTEDNFTSKDLWRFSYLIGQTAHSNFAILFLDILQCTTDLRDIFLSKHEIKRWRDLLSVTKKEVGDKGR